MVSRIASLVVSGLLLSPLSVLAQSSTLPQADIAKLSGPRLGVTFLSQEQIAKLWREDGIHVGSTITQIGWQFEKRLYSSDNAFTALTELVLLVGGLDQNTTLPSATWLLGFRSHEGMELGIGPVLTPRGSSMAIAAGFTMKSGRLNIPLNLAIVPSSSGTRVSMLTGFNVRR